MHTTSSHALFFSFTCCYSETFGLNLVQQTITRSQASWVRLDWCPPCREEFDCFSLFCLFSYLLVLYSHLGSGGESEGKILAWFWNVVPRQYLLLKNLLLGTDIE